MVTKCKPFEKMIWLSNSAWDQQHRLMHCRTNQLSFLRIIFHRVVLVELRIVPNWSFEKNFVHLYTITDNDSPQYEHGTSQCSYKRQGAGSLGVGQLGTICACDLILRESPITKRGSSCRLLQSSFLRQKTRMQKYCSLLATAFLRCTVHVVEWLR